MTDHRKTKRERKQQINQIKKNKILNNVPFTDFSLKELNTLLKKVMSEAEVLRLDISNKQKELNNKNSSIKEIQNKINSFGIENKIPSISEHAILRYLERVKGMDLKSIEQEMKDKMFDEKTLQLISQLGPSGTYPNGEFQIIMKNNVVVTVK